MGIYLISMWDKWYRNDDVYDYELIEAPNHITAIMLGTELAQDFIEKECGDIIEQEVDTVLYHYPGRDRNEVRKESITDRAMMSCYGVKAGNNTIEELKQMLRDDGVHRFKEKYCILPEHGIVGF